MIKLKDLVEQLNIYNINDDYYIFEDEFKLNEGLIVLFALVQRQLSEERLVNAILGIRSIVGLR
jgi:hypothetical protein